MNHGIKRCTHCKLPKPLEEFYRNPSTGYWDSWCKLCGREHHRNAYTKIGRPIGERNAKSKFTDEQRAGIAQSGLSPTKLAKLHGVHRCTIQRIQRTARNGLTNSG